MDKYVTKHPKGLSESTASDSLPIPFLSKGPPFKEKSPSRFRLLFNSPPLNSRRDTLFELKRISRLMLVSKSENKDAVEKIADFFQRKPNKNMIQSIIKENKSAVFTLLLDNNLFSSASKNFSQYFTNGKYLAKMESLYKIYQFTIFRPTSVSFTLSKIPDRFFAFRSLLRNEFLKGLLKTHKEEEILKLEFDQSAIFKTHDKEIVLEFKNKEKIQSPVLSKLASLEKTSLVNSKEKIEENKNKMQIKINTAQFSNDNKQNRRGSLLRMSSLSDVSTISSEETMPKLTEDTVFLYKKLLYFISKPIENRSQPSKRDSVSISQALPSLSIQRRSIFGQRPDLRKSSLLQESPFPGLKIQIRVTKTKSKTQQNKRDSIDQSRLSVQKSSGRLSSNSLLKNRNFQELQILNKNKESAKIPGNFDQNQNIHKKSDEAEAKIFLEHQKSSQIIISKNFEHAQNLKNRPSILNKRDHLLSYRLEANRNTEFADMRNPSTERPKLRVSLFKNPRTFKPQEVKENEERELIPKQRKTKLVNSKIVSQIRKKFPYVL